MKYFIFLWVTFFLFQCEKNTSSVTDNSAPKDFILWDSVAVAYNQTLINEDENICLRFKELMSDGRCPIDVMCFWEGNAEVKFAFTADDHKTEFSLDTFPGYTRDTTLFGYRIGLVGLLPFPHTEREIIPDQYQATVVVSRELMFDSVHR